MTLKQVVIKNLKFNLSKYKAFFLCSSFVVMVLFLYSSFYFNPSVISYAENTPLRFFMKFALYGIGIFDILFITYANNSFVRSRNAEFGLFMILGMNKKNVEKYIQIESYLISGLSLAFGLLAGCILSKLFFMIGIDILQVKKLEFAITLKSFLVPIGMYVLISIWLMLGRKRFLKSLQLVEMLRSSKQGKEIKVRSYLGFLGLILMAGSLVLLSMVLNGVVSSMLYVYIALAITLIGLFLTVTHLGGMLTTVKRKNYEHNMISLAAVRFRFAEYRKVLFVVSMLCTIAIVSVSIVYSLYNQVKHMTETFSPYDIQYLASTNYENLSQDEVEALIESSDSEIIEKSEMPCLLATLYAKREGKFRLWDNDSTFISLSTLNKRVNGSYTIEPGHVLTLRNMLQEDGWQRAGEEIRIHVEDDTYAYKIQEEVYEVLGNDNFSRIFDVKYVIVLRDEAYQYLLDELDINESFMYTYQLSDESNVLAAFKSVLEADTNEVFNENYIQAKYDRYSKVSSKRVEYLANMRQFGFQFFIVGFIGVVMLISCGVVLYFKVMTDLEEMKHKFSIITKIGMKHRELKQMIRKELRPLFIMPIVIGGLLGVAFVSVLFVNVAFYPKLVRDSFIVVFAFVCCQSIFFVLTQKRCVREVKK